MTWNQYIEEKVSGWGRFPAPVECRVLRPDLMREIEVPEGQCIARGLGRSYGDSAINTDRYVLSTLRLNRFLAFDTQKGVISVEAGTTLDEILEVILPKGWFVPVTPGTKYVTVGGCVACDVHGKNHHVDGTFGQHVLSLKLKIADGSILSCSPTENRELFWATVGGMGLTGIILEVTFQLIPIRSSNMVVNFHLTENLEDTLLKIDSNSSSRYSVAWIDSFASGRGVLMLGEHMLSDQNKLCVEDSKPKTLPWGLIGNFLHPYSMKLFNQLYYWVHRNKVGEQIVDYNRYFYPLDGVSQWNLVYGKQGFLQYQCVFPKEKALEGIQALFDTGIHPYLIVVKQFGEQNPSYLSFPQEGVTIAMDLPVRDLEVVDKLQEMDQIVLELGGRVYLAKDACLSPESFQKMYPRLPEWLEIKRAVDPKGVFQSDQSRRLFRGLI